MALALGLLSGGCALFGVAAYKFSGPPAVDAKYAPTGQPLLVMVENDRNPIAMRLDADRLAEAVSKRLGKKTAAPIVDYGNLRELRGRDAAAYRSMAITRVGQTLGAGQVVFVNLVDFEIEPAPGSDAYQGKAEARVRMVDVASGQTLWPLDLSGGYPVAVQTSFTRTREGVDPQNLGDGLHQSLAEQIARLFYQWKPDSDSDSPDRG